MKNIYDWHFCFSFDSKEFAEQWAGLKEFWEKHRCHLQPIESNVWAWKDSYWMGNLSVVDATSFYQEMQAIYCGTARAADYPDTSYLPDRVPELLLLTPYAIGNLDSETAYKLYVSFSNMLSDYQDADDYWGSGACYIHEIKLKPFEEIL